MDNIELTKRLKWYENKYGPYVEKRGLHNWKNLFKKPTFMEMVVMALMVGYLIIAFMYFHDIKACKESIETLEADACVICSAQANTCPGGDCLDLGDIPAINYTGGG